jgi:thiamine biosynthesis protein ThiI
VAQIIARRENAGALITGESVGQVASQTMPAIACTDAVCEIPVFRPLIGMDKDEVIAIARNKTDTFDLSVLPYEDCCTVFTPKHPRTRPTIEYVEKAEEAFDWRPMVETAAETARLVVIGY